MESMLEQIEQADGLAAAAALTATAAAAANAAATAQMRHARSFHDVEEVLLRAASANDAKPKAAAAAAAAAAARPPRGGELLGGLLTAVQEDEDDEAQMVIVCEPEGSSLMMGGLHPRGSLFERPVNIESAKAHHAHFRQVLREHGVRVLTVREILAHGVDEHMGARLALERLAAATLTYTMAGGHSVQEVAESDRAYLTDAYKREVIEHMSVTQLIDIILINPTVHLTPSGRDTGFTAAYTFEPLSNLVYTRDQQITTCRGIVMGRLRSQQRQREVELMRFCFNKLGLPIVGAIEAPGFLEGGDFFPLGRDLALLGVGLRSNEAAAAQLMERDLLGARRLAVVRDEFDRHQDRMHLDCVFSPLGSGCCLMLDDIIGGDSPKRRTVDVYARSGATGAYALERTGVEFSHFITSDLGWSIIPVPAAHQLAYACNTLNLGGSRIISAHPSSARAIVGHPRFRGDVRVIDFSSITSMYGSVHCASQVVLRAPRRLANGGGAGR
ncbi:arginine deiminase [Raphidocelis subcapitata]|uniref:Arginine deiminase n=1 Tax=Raphidocelis subcapitata TaxID=307507 RepID=A0A2V0NXA3_9CHLO|nr:arginine deiminase [Raphidocelis subcapitata]|eukprot:GBF90210.1 arginine deiminase [Raphidocelis subcapitata]